MRNLIIRNFSIFPIALLATILLGAAANAQTIPAKRTFDCVVEPSLRLKIATPVAGILRMLMVDRGDFVRKGTVLAKLESAVEEANVALSEARAQNDSTVLGRRARLNFLERKHGRISQLQTRGAASDAALDEAETDLSLARHDLREAEFSWRIAGLEHKRALELLQQRSIVSPIAGVVVERSLGPGEYAYEQAPITTIAQIDPLNVEVYVPTAHYSSVRVGDRAQVEFSEPLRGSYAAIIDVIDSVFDARSGTFGIRLKLPNPGNKLPAGMRCRLTFESVNATP